MSITFEQLIEHNNRNTKLLVFGIVLFTALLFGSFTTPFVSTDVNDLIWPFLIGASVGVIISLFGALASFYFGKDIIMTISGARTVHYHDDPVLFNVTEEMAIAAGIPVPKLIVIHDESPNAFATGRDPEHAVIGITTGLRKKLNRQELQAVVAHEIAHVKNYDIRLMMMVAVFAGLIVLAADFYKRRLFDGFQSRARGVSQAGARGGIFALVAGIIALVLALIAPFIASFMQLAVSREREYLADASAIKFTRDPDSLVSALRKISGDTDPLDTDNRALEHMFIVNPQPSRRQLRANWDSVWSTHPPLVKRIARINALVRSIDLGEPEV